MSKLTEGSPARYRLAAEPGAIQVAVNKSIIPSASDFQAEQTDSIRERLDLPRIFTPPNPDREWGFGPVLKDTGIQNPEWVIFQADLPQLKTNDDVEGFAVAATLGLLFSTLNEAEVECSSEIQQGLKVSLTNSKRSFSSNDLYIALFSPIMNFLKATHDGGLEKAVSEAMLSAYTSLRGVDKSGYFRNLITLNRPSDEIMYFRAPGNATELQYSKREKILGRSSKTTGPLIDRVITETSHRLTPKNLDHVDSQLTLLAGVAKLEEIATGGYFKSS